MGRLLSEGRSVDNRGSLHAPAGGVVGLPTRNERASNPTGRRLLGTYPEPPIPFLISEPPSEKFAIRYVQAHHF